MNPEENKEVLTEALKDKEAEPATRYFSTLDVETILSEYLPEDNPELSYSDQDHEKYYLLRDWVDEQGKIVSLEEIDNSGIISKIVPADLIDEVENKILAESDPIKDKLENINSDIDRLLSDLEDEDLYIESGWVYNQLREFLHDLKSYAPKTPSEYFELRDSFIYDHVSHI